MRTTGRRVVSVVFADLVGFTALAERLDPEDVARVQDAWFSLAAAAVEQHGGAVEKFIGDAVMATFGTDRADDTDPVRAVRAARRLVRDTAGLGVALGLGPGDVQVRVGVNTGEVVVTRTRDGWRVTGDTVNTASRLQTAAAPGQVLLGPETAFGVGHAFVLQDGERLDLRGKESPLATWSVVEERPSPRRGLRHHGLHAPMLGRADALGTLRRALAEAAGSPAPAGVLLVAPPGVGKSRLVEELCREVAPAGHPSWTVRLGDEPEHGYTCVARLLEAAWRSSVGPGGRRPGVTAPEPPQPPVPTVDDVAALLTAHGYDAPHAAVHAAHTVRLLGGGRLDAEPADLYTAWTAVLDATSAPAPVWVVEDVHLAGPDLRAFLRHALAHPRHGGRLVVATARPTAGLPRPGDDLPTLPTLHLEPLGAGTTRDLVLALVGPGTVPEDHLEGIVGASGGNPLFVEELLRSWIQSGALRHTGRRWAFSGPSVAPVLPSTVQAIYQGQLDALPAGSRGVVERGSVPGVTFPSGALPALGVPEPDDPLDDLTRTGLLVGPHAHPLSGPGYTYRHALLRDAAYGSISRQDRAELHVRFARWLAGAGDRDAVAQELVGRHLALAVETLPATAAGLADGTPTAALADEAADRLEGAAAGHLVSSPQRSADLLQLALDLPGTTGGPVRLRRHLALAEAERRAGRLEHAMTAFAEGGDAARVRGDADAVVTAALGYESALFASRLPRSRWGGRSIQLLRAAEAALPSDATARRSTVLAALGRALVFCGDVAAGAETCRRAVGLAEAGGDPAALAGALLALRSTQTGPASLPERIAAGARVQAAARRTEDLELRLEAARLRLTDLLEAGDLAGADVAQAEATALVERLGRPLHFWYPPMWRSMRALLAGDYGTARELIDRFAVEARRAHYGAADQVWGGQMLRLHLDTGDVAGMLGTVEHLLTIHPRYSFAAAAVLARLGEREEAQLHLDRCTADDFAGVPDDLAWSSTMAHLAETAAVLEDAATAARIADRLEPWAGQHVVVGAGAMCLGAGAHYVGIARRTAGDLAAARTRLEAAVAMNAALPAPGLAARSRAELARTLARLGDEAGARSLATTARAAATGLGMTDLADDLRLLTGPSGTATPGGRTATAPTEVAGPPPARAAGGAT